MILLLMITKKNKTKKDEYVQKEWLQARQRTFLQVKLEQEAKLRIHQSACISAQ